MSLAPYRECLGRESSEEETVIPGKAAEAPNAELHSNFGDARTRRVGGFERPPNLVECSPVEILHRRCAEVAQEGIPECSLGNASRAGCSTERYSPSYFGTADILNTFENSSTVFNSFSAPADYATSPSLFDYTIYGATSASAMTTDVHKAVNSDYASYVYVTDQTLPNPYDQLPSYWDQEVSAIATVRAPERDCQAIALLTTAGIAFAVGRRRRRPVS
jgi:hypothetical protein